MRQQKANRIAEQRKKKGLTQQQLADALGVHWMTVSKLERGKMQLTLGWIDRIAVALDVQVLDLVTPDAAQQEISIAGKILNGLIVENSDRGPDHETVGSLVNDLLSNWYRISGGDFEPFFFDGDLVRITDCYWRGTLTEQLLGRLCHVTFEDGAGVNFSVFVIIDKYLGGDRFDLRSVKGIKFENVKAIEIGTFTAMLSATDKAGEAVEIPNSA